MRNKKKYAGRGTKNDTRGAGWGGIKGIYGPNSTVNNLARVKGLYGTRETWAIKLRYNDNDLDICLRNFGGLFVYYNKMNWIHSK